MCVKCDGVYYRGELGCVRCVSEPVEPIKETAPKSCDEAIKCRHGLYMYQCGWCGRD